MEPVSGSCLCGGVRFEPFGGMWPDGPEVAVRFSSLHDDSGIRPQYHSHAGSAAPWHVIPDDGLRRCSGSTAEA
jgi:hypothetical protein